MTQHKYWHEPDTLEFTSAINEVGEHGISLEENYFYPVGGGQPHDTGWLHVGDEKHRVTQVRNKDGKVWLKLEEAPGLKPGQEVRGKIDPDRRGRLKRMHTAAHVASAVIIEKTGALITGNQLGEETSRIDYELEDYNPEYLKQLETEVNEEVMKAHEVSTRIVSREEADKEFAQLSTLKIGLPEHIKTVRLVQIGNIDLQACGGTHCSNTEEVGRVTFVNFKNKGKNNRRVYFEIE